MKSTSTSSPAKSPIKKQKCIQTPLFSPSPKKSFIELAECGENKRFFQTFSFLHECLINSSLPVETRLVAAEELLQKCSSCSVFRTKMKSLGLFSQLVDAMKDRIDDCLFFELGCFSFEALSKDEFLKHFEGFCMFCKASLTNFASSIDEQKKTVDFILKISRSPVCEWEEKRSVASSFSSARALFVSTGLLDALVQTHSSLAGSFVEIVCVFLDRGFFEQCENRPLKESVILKICSCEEAKSLSFLRILCDAANGPVGCALLVANASIFSAIQRLYNETLAQASPPGRASINERELCLMCGLLANLVEFSSVFRGWCCSEGLRLLETASSFLSGVAGELLDCKNPTLPPTVCWLAVFMGCFYLEPEASAVALSVLPQRHILENVIQKFVDLNLLNGNCAILENSSLKKMLAALQHKT